MTTLPQSQRDPWRHPQRWLPGLSLGVLVLLIPLQLATGFLYTYGVWGCLLLIDLILLRTRVPQIPAGARRHGVGAALGASLLLLLLAGALALSGLSVGDDRQHCTATYGTIYGLPQVFLRAQTVIGAGPGCAGPQTVAQIFAWDGSALLLDWLLCLAGVLLGAWGWRVVRSGR